MTDTNGGFGRITYATGLMYFIGAMVFASVAYLGLIGADDYARASGMALAVVIIGLLFGGVMLLFAVTTPSSAGDE